MKYSATVLIVDSQGNTVHERELSADEIIDELLLTPPQKPAEEEYIGELAGAPVFVTKKPKPGKKKLSVAEFQAGLKKAGKKTGGKTCGKCKQPGHNAATCGKQKEESSVPEILTESEYDQVKEGQADGVSSKDLADDLGLPHEQVNFAFAAPEYSLFVHHMAARRKGIKN